MSPTRYSTPPLIFTWDMREAEDGAFVLHSDYTALEAEWKELYDKWASDQENIAYEKAQKIGYITAIDRLQAELAAARAEIERLQEYVKHHDFCRKYTTYGAYPCTCGLDRP